MTTRGTIDEPSISRGHRNLLLASAVMTFALITMGGIVCVTESGRGCPDWPGCYGQVVPPLQADAVIEYVHRLLAGLTSPVIFAAVIMSWLKARSVPWVTRPVALSVFFLLAVIVFGAFAIVTGIPPWIAAIDIGSALMVLALLLTACVVAFARGSSPSFSGPVARLSLWTSVGALVVLASSVLVVDSGSIGRCLGWPIYGEPVGLGDWQGTLGIARRVLAVITSISVIAILVQAWRGQHEHPAVMRAAAGVGILFIVETALGVLIGANGSAVVLRGVYVATTAAFWSSLVILTVLAGLTEPARLHGRLEMHPTVGQIR